MEIKPISYGPRISKGEAKQVLESVLHFGPWESEKFLNEQDPVKRKDIFQKVMDRYKGLEYA